VPKDDLASEQRVDGEDPSFRSVPTDFCLSAADGTIWYVQLSSKRDHMLIVYKGRNLRRELYCEQVNSSVVCFLPLSKGETLIC